MKLNFYYEFPIPNSISSDTCHLLAAQMYYELCKKNNQNIEINAINSHGLTYIDGLPSIKSCPGCKFSHFFVIIENPSNKKYYVISYWDKLKDITTDSSIWDLENCIGIFPYAGVHADDFTYKPIDLKYTPISPITIYKSCENRANELYKKNDSRETPKNLFFRGGKYGFREYISNNDKRFTINHERINTTHFIDEMSKNTINIDINSVAEISGRTIDTLALGSALLRPKLTIKYRNELIPDYHYAQVECEDLSDWPKLADAYVEKFERLKKDTDFVEYISKNGRRWYEENASTEAHVKILNEVIDLTKLA